MRKTFLLFSGLILACLFTMAQDEARLMRFPSIHNNQVVFTYAGDLYTVDKDGGIARKLTNDLDGYEMFARFSPDGKFIAFTGQYDGNTEVYLMPANGGEPERMTYTATLNRDDISDRMGPNNIVMTWKDDNNVVYRSRKKSFNSFKGHLFQVNKDGGLSEQLPLPSGGFCSYSPDKGKLAYNRVFREFRTWKYYQGGMADDIWVYDFNTKETENITNNKHQDIFPMWHGDNIYFLSDRDRIMNLFVYNTESKEITKLTDFTDYDIKFPSLGNESIIFEKGGFLYTFNINTQEVSKLEISIADDMASGRNAVKDASKFINSYAISPDGKRVVFGARGDVFTLPVKSGITRNLTYSPGVHDRNVEWSPDGKYISYVSDVTGNDEIYIINQDGKYTPEQLTREGGSYKYNPVWSPDGTKLMWSDKALGLYYIDIESKKITQVDQAKGWEMRSYNWSFDNNWITYVVPSQREVSKITIYNVKSGDKEIVTSDWYDCSNPVFSDDGKYLFFTSARDFNPIYSWTEWNHAYRDMQKIYMITLRKDVPSPFEPKNDEVAVKEDEAYEEGKKEDKDEAEDDDTIEIDFDGIKDRIIGLPGSAGFYFNLSPVKNTLYYGAGNSTGPAGLKFFDFDSQKETELGPYASFIISFDKKKMFISNKGKYAVISLPKSKITLKKFIDLTGMDVAINFQSEWQQIFDESWRQMRDFFYAPNMHGVDWDAIHDKYTVLIPYVKNRNDLNYVIGEMIGELSVGHAYVNGGDKPSPKRVKTGLFGAELSKDKSGYYKIDMILKGENWTNSKRSPFTEVGVDVNEGDYILEINGKSTKDMNDIYEIMLGKAGKQVELTINDKASLDGSHKVIIKPIADESDLYYYNWVQDNIEKVNKATNGDVGYIHIPDMGPGGLNEFVKHFYPQLTKKALIIDDRGNGGGNVSPMIIERLRRELVLMRVARNTESYTMPAQIMVGPKVLLIDHYSASDGDLFAYQFKKMGLGKTIGVRTWGGVVGIRGSHPFIDGGQLRKPEFSTFDLEGNWAIEGRGVTPDIILDNDPAKEFAGEDEQLNKAIEVILEEMENFNYDQMPEIPEFPDKSK